MSEELRHELARLTYSPEIVSFELTREQGLEILKEIERLNNIINEIEDSIVGKINVLYQVKNQVNAIQELNILLNKIKELKGVNKVFKLYELPEYQNTKLYIEDQVIIFDHLDGLYSYCWLEEDKTKIAHIKITTLFEKYKDGYKLVEEGENKNDKI